MKINVLGGGPAGLYFAYLARKRLGAVEVHVHERNAPDATYGFGVVLAGAGLAKLRDADADSYARITAISEPLSNQDILLDGAAVTVSGPDYGGAVGRLELLCVLQELCRENGVQVTHHDDVQNPDLLDDCDLVVGADGANSVLRERHAAEFGTRKGMLTNSFAWYGVLMDHDRPTLSFRHACGGAFVAHYYPYGKGMCTIVVECDRAAWEGAGFATMTEDQRKSYSEALFSEELHGRPLISNKSEWRNFIPTTNENWSVGHRVLIGDALRRAHFSIGSGTRIAMEDSIALVQALVPVPGDMPAALAQFRAERGRNDLLTQAARESYMWYEDMAAHMSAAASPRAFVFDYLTRTSRVDEARAAALYPKFMAELQAERAGSA